MVQRIEFLSRTNIGGIYTDNFEKCLPTRIWKIWERMNLWKEDCSIEASLSLGAVQGFVFSTQQEHKIIYTHKSMVTTHLR
jgi:hypothetical protein